MLKVLGTGMALSPHEVRVERLGASDAQVVLSTKARIRLGQVGGGELQIRWAEHGPQEVLVEATLGLSVA